MPFEITTQTSLVFPDMDGGERSKRETDAAASISSI